MSMRSKTTLLIITIVFTATAITFLSGMYFTNNSLKKTMEQDLSFAIGIANSLVGMEMELEKTKAATVAARLSAADSHEKMLELMEEQFHASPEITDLVVFDRNGTIASYSVPPHEHNSGVNAESLEKVYAGGSIMSSPFYCPTQGEFIINIYTPMGSDRILAMSIPGLIFTDILSKHRLWQTGDMFMLNEEGTFVGAADPEVVLAMNNYMTRDKANPAQPGEELEELIRTILSTDNGVHNYSVDGAAHLCAYSLIDNSLMGWRVAVTVPFAESPQADALRGQIYAAAVLLAIGVISAFFLAKLIAQPFKEIQRQNNDLVKLNETIQTQAMSILEEHERIKLMLDATPLACRLWDRQFHLVECNEAAVKLFSLKDKQEYLKRYFELSPEFQPDGQTTLDKIRMSVSEAFEKGKSKYEWMYRAIDGASIPCEVTMVRVPYGGDYVVAAYSRDLREQKKMLSEIERRDTLLDTSRRVSFVLFDTAEGRDVHTPLMESMELLGKCIDVDQVYIAQNEMVDCTPCFTCKSAWAGDSGSATSSMTPGKSFPWGLDLEWDKRFLQGECLNGPVKALSPAIQGFFAPFEAKSVLVIPVFVQDLFWGLVGFTDCRRERIFSEEEIDILRSMSLMMATAVHRNEQAARIAEAHTRIRLLTNTTPLGFNLWDRDYNNIETNDTAVSLFGLESQQEYLERFYELSPAYQPDGGSSREKANKYVQEAFETGYCRFEWLHQKPDGTPLPSEVTLVRLAYDGDYVVAGYIRDLREQKKMIAAIDQRDNLLQTVNQAADILLRTEPEGFSDTLHQCMGMIARAVNADRMYLCQNHVENGKLHFTQRHEWSEHVQPYQNAALTTNVAYDDQTPEIRDALSRGKCVHSLVRDLPPLDRGQLGAQGVLSILTVPVFIQNDFWGFVGFDNCHSEKLFTENEESIMRVASLQISNALLRNEMVLNLRVAAEQLKTALREAEEANSAKSSFLARMSHEMRTPLNAVIGLSELTLDGKALNEEAESNLEKIYGAGTTLLSIVNDILDISKIEAGKFEIIQNMYDVSSMINDTVTQNVLRIGSRSIQFILDIDARMLARLYGDELRIKQIINNLLSNAFKYTEEGTVEFGLACEREGDVVWLTIRIADTGRGLRPEDRARLFTDYTRFDAAANRKVGGTGLGLSITKRLVEMMGGQISVESEYGKGSVFTVKIQQQYVNDDVIGADVAENLRRFRYSAGKRSQNARNHLKLPYARVLVVDDNITNLDVAKGLMKPYGMQIDCVTSGQEAVDAIRKEKPKYNAVFMDHMMPGMDGVEATRIIRKIKTEYARTIPIIALTANAIAGNERIFLSEGFQAFIPKPVDLARLDDVIRNFVRDKEQEAPVDGGAQATGERLGGMAPAISGGDDETGLLALGDSIDGLDISKGLDRFGGGKPFMQILRSYAINTRPLLESITTVDKRNIPSYATTVHGIKGASRNICAGSVGDQAETLEHAAKAGDLEFVTQNNQAFLAAAWKLIEGIDFMLAGMERSKLTKNKPDIGILEKLRAACDRYDLDAIDAAMEEIENCKYDADDGLVDWLRTNIAQMNFAAVVEKLSPLSKNPE